MMKQRGFLLEKEKSENCGKSYFCTVPNTNEQPG